jgi:predicted RNase H-like HicB family nuclease
MKHYCEFSIDYFQDEDGVFTATAPMIPGCMASGDTIEDAYENIKAAIESCLEVRHKLNMPTQKSVYYGKNIYKIPVAA